MTDLLPLTTMLAIPATVLLTVRYLNRRDDRLALAEECSARPFESATEV